MAIFFPVYGGLEMKIQSTQEPPKVDKSANNSRIGMMVKWLSVHCLHVEKIEDPPDQDV